MVERERWDLKIPKGGDYSQSFEFQDSDGNSIDLTGYTFRSQIRENFDRDSAEIAEFTVTIPDPTNGQIFITLTDEITLAITQNQGHYDILAIDTDDKVNYFIYGAVDFQETVTVKP